MKQNGTFRQGGRLRCAETPFVLKEYPLRPVKNNEVLVKVTMSTICRSDIHSYEGHRPNPCPGILDHEIIGVIDQLGSDIKKDMRGDTLKVGDRITWSEYFYHGDCYYREVHDMPQKCDGVRKYGHDLAEEDPHFLGGLPSIATSCRVPGFSSNTGNVGQDLSVRRWSRHV